MQAQDELENDSPNDQIAPSQFVGSSYQQRQMAGTMQQPAAQMQMAPPQSAQLPKQFAPISPDEQAIMDRMVNSVHTNLIDRGSGSDQSGSFQSNSAGPPPFPLNLLPQDSLKQVIGGSMRRSRIETQPSYFGSWHNNSNLPSGGFHSYAPRMSHLPEPAPKTAYHRASQSRPTVGASRASSSQSSSSLAELRRLPPHEARVETYPPYLRLSSVSGY
jgi:hypothetical protein